jgi:hypothetical protein
MSEMSNHSKQYLFEVSEEVSKVVSTCLACLIGKILLSQFGCFARVCLAEPIAHLGILAEERGFIPPVRCFRCDIRQDNL